MTHDPIDKPREFWIYEGKKNCSPLRFVYLEQQEIKVLAPENWDEIKVIEYAAYQSAIERVKRLEAVLERLTKVGPPSRPTTGLEYAQVALEDNCRIATEALKESP